MSVDELLSKDEIDVLLNGVDEGNVEVEGAQVDDEAHTYDLTSQDHIVRGRLPTLEMINERFCRYTRVSMFNFLRQTIEVESAGIENIKFSEYLQTLGMPSHMNMVKIHPLRGTALFVVSAELVVKLVDKFFGGEGGSKLKIEEREFTKTELRITQKVLNQIFIDMKEAWKTVMQVSFEQVGLEANPAMANIISPSEVVVLSSFTVTIDKDECNFQVAIPYSMLEPVRETLDAGVQSDIDDTDERWVKSLQEDILDVKIPFGCKVAERKITLREILAFKVGDVIPITMQDTNTLQVKGIPIFETRLGQSRDNLALKIVKQLPTGR